MVAGGSRPPLVAADSEAPWRGTLERRPAGMDGPPPDETIWSGPMLGFLLSVVVALPIIFAVLILTTFDVLGDSDDGSAGAVAAVVSDATQALDTVLIPSEPATVSVDESTAPAVGESVSPAEAEAPADPAPQLGQVYVVVAGDVLHQIALRFAVTAEALAAYNALPNPNALRVGQELRIPPPGYQPPSDQDESASPDFATGPLPPRG